MGSTRAQLVDNDDDDDDDDDDDGDDDDDDDDDVKTNFKNDAYLGYHHSALVSLLVLTLILHNKCMFVAAWTALSQE